METILSRPKCDKLVYAWRWVWHEICMGMARSMHIGSGDKMCLWKCGLHGVNTKYFTYEWTISPIYLCTFFYIHVCICIRIYIVHTLDTTSDCECECDRVCVCTCACDIYHYHTYRERQQRTCGDGKINFMNLLCHENCTHTGQRPGVFVCARVIVFACACTHTEGHDRGLVVMEKINILYWENNLVHFIFTLEVINENTLVCHCWWIHFFLYLI